MTSTEPPEATVDVVDGAVRMADARLAGDPTDVSQGGTGTAVAVPTAHVVGTPTIATVPALALDRARFATLQGVGAVMTPATAAAHRWPTTNRSTVAWDPAGPITPQVQDVVQAALDRQLPGARIDVERGYVGDATLRLVSAIAIGVVAFLTLVATLIATALSQAESQAFSGTLAAVGATRGTRRRIAGAQAGFLALAGVALGLIVGLVPGLLTARMATSPHYYDAVQVGPTVVVPWLELLVPVALVPLAAVLVAAACIRATPTVTRRLT